MIKVLEIVCCLSLIGCDISEIVYFRKMNRWKKRLKELGDEFEITTNCARESTKILQDSFTEIEEKILCEVSEAIHNLEAGRNDEAFNILTCLADTVGLDIASEKAKKKN